MPEPTSTGGQSVTTVAIVEDHRVFVDSLGIIIRQEPEFAFLGSAGTLTAARELIREKTPHVLLLDVGLPDGNGLDLVDYIKKVSPQTQIIVLTSLSDEATLMRAISCGVSGFISKSSPLTELLSAIRDAAQGEIVLPTSLLVGLLMRMPRDRAAAYREEKGWERLTVREQEILEKLAMGKSGNDIANELHIALLTVRTHIRNILSKLGVHSRLEAVAFGLKEGLIKPPS